MVVGRGQGPAQAAIALFIEGRVWKRNPRPNPQLDPRRSLLRFVERSSAKLAGPFQCPATA
jgi:hypothetical protein